MDPSKQQLSGEKIAPSRIFIVVNILYSIILLYFAIGDFSTGQFHEARYILIFVSLLILLFTFLLWKQKQERYRLTVVVLDIVAFVVFATGTVFYAIPKPTEPVDQAGTVINLEKQLNSTKQAWLQELKNTDLLAKDIGILVKNITLATRFPKGKSLAEFSKYSNKEIGFSFEYPKEWGDVNIEISRSCEKDNWIGFMGKFSNYSEAQFGTWIKRPCDDGGRDGSSYDYLWKQSTRDKDPWNETISIGNKNNMVIWYASGLGYTATDLHLNASAPLLDKDFPGIGMMGPPMN